MEAEDIEMKKRNYTYDELVMLLKDAGEDNLQAADTLKGRKCICYFRSWLRINDVVPHLNSNMALRYFMERPLKDMPKYLNDVHEEDPEVLTGYGLIARWRLRIAK